MTKMTIGGVATTKTLGQEQYEKFSRHMGRKSKTFYSYDYRSLDGELFSCIKPTLEDCRAARDAWEKARNAENYINIPVFSETANDDGSYDVIGHRREYVD